jgi:hypothetical protein
MAKQKPKTPTRTNETTAEIAASIFSESLAHLRDQIRGIRDGAIDTAPHDPASRIAWLAERAAKVAAEQRKAEKGEIDAIKKLSPAVMLTWVKAQTPEYRARLVRDIAALDAVDRKSVLG